ncbi:uncharacterized protein C8A04DRAFT_30586 [Dichotomopilus funicola]|uniref:Uncharacterized protein n=1 Tax=Dichotomopilus funicola TaxID=1934379 RepID=A0AAN6UZ50_9PEZI|nr:hypothetical protein C8A04DRAFT_30586 [Dichotomopilus funicola]
MVSFRSLFAGAAILAAPIMAALSPEQIAAGINSITEKTQALQAPAQSITLVNAPLIIIGQGPFPEIIAGFADIVSTATSLANQIGASTVKKREALSARQSGAEVVSDAFRAYVRVNQALLNILIGKAGLLEQVPLVGAPVASALRGVEAITDSIAITLINLFEERAAELTSDANSNDATLTITIQKYEGLQLKKRAETFIA